MDSLPKRLMFWVALSVESLRIRRFSLEALEPFLRRRISQQPTAFSPRFFLADLQKGAGQLAAAATELEALRTLGHSSDGLLRELGNLYYGLKDYERARSCLEMVAARHGSDPLFCALLGMACVYTDHYDQSIDYLRRAAAPSDAKPELHEALGYALFQLRRFAESAVAYERSLSSGRASVHARDDAARAHVHRANELLACDEKAAAINELHSALRLDPADDIAQKIQGTLAALGGTGSPLLDS